MTISLLLCPPLARISEYPSFGESVAFQLNGLVVVFLALGSIWGLLELTGLIFRRKDALAVTPLPAIPAKPDSIPASSEDVSPEIFAVIAVAVATVISQPHRISQVVAETPPRDWAREGRREIFGSHKFR
jgi:hypothetical protein